MVDQGLLVLRLEKFDHAAVERWDLQSLPSLLASCPPRREAEAAADTTFRANTRRMAEVKVGMIVGDLSIFKRILGGNSGNM